MVFKSKLLKNKTTDYLSIYIIEIVINHTQLDYGIIGWSKIPLDFLRYHII